MLLSELIQITDSLFYADSSSYRVISSKQRELLSIINPNIDIAKIDVKIINKYIQHLKDSNNSNATINAKLAYISRILNYAYQNRLIQNKPYIPHFKVILNKEKYLSKEELRLMLLWCKNNNQKELIRIILIGCYTGLRINNILSLTKNNIQDNKLILHDKKTNTNFILPISIKLKYILANLENFKLNYQQVYYIFVKMKQELKLDDRITIHTLRHTFCSNLIQKDIPITTIQKLANHKKITTTMRYSHLNDKQLEEAINVL